MKTSELEQIKKALEPLALDHTGRGHLCVEGLDDDDYIETLIHVGEVRAARAAIALLARVLAGKEETDV